MVSGRVSRSPPSAVDEKPDQEGVFPEPENLDFAVVRLAPDAATGLPPGKVPLGKPNPEDPAPLPERGSIPLPNGEHPFAKETALHILQHPGGMPIKLALDTSGHSRARMLIGALITAVGVLFLGLGLFADGGVSKVGLGVAAVFVGMTVLGPVIAPPATRVRGWPLPRIKGMTGQLAKENALRNPKRTASTAAALMIGVGLVGFITIFADSTKASITDVEGVQVGHTTLIEGDGPLRVGEGPVVREARRLDRHDRIDALVTDEAPRLAERRRRVARVVAHAEELDRPPADSLLESDDAHIRRRRNVGCGEHRSAADQRCGGERKHGPLQHGKSP